jgi:UDP-N-acetylglucosamine--N-acetylmuramyl-(pentapeptide) pyrophosphoryl-undecaprenol N-acetylglucosamine transferase
VSGSGTGPAPERGCFAVIAGGGTGGHVLPAVAIGQALVADGHPPSTVHFVGARRGMEATLVPEAGFEATLLPGRGIKRRLSLDNVGAVAGIVQAIFQAWRVVRRLRPAVVVSVGGYASVACTLAAVGQRVPIIVAEQNAVPGLANRLAGRFARACAVSFPGTPLPRAVVTGNPVRTQMQHVDRTPAGRAAARAALHLPVDARVLAVAGGSLGARRINDATVALAAAWRDREGTAIRHVVGRRDHDEVRAAALAAGLDPDGGSTGGLVYQVVAFEHRMDLVYAAADLTVQRSGAGTCFELAAAGLAAVLVPLPGAPGDHQGFNARQLASAGGAVVLDDAEVSGPRLAEVVEPLLADPERLEEMGRGARTLARPDAAAAVAALAEAHARAR